MNIMKKVLFINYDLKTLINLLSTKNAIKKNQLSIELQK